MAAADRRVVITGIGVVTPIGITLADFWQSLQQGKSGVGPIEAFDTTGLSTRFAGEIGNFDAKQIIDKKDRKSLRIMARGIQMAVSAAQLAIDESKVDKNALDPTRFGVEFGAGLLPTELEELADASRVSTNCQPGVVDLKTWGEKGLAAIPPLWMLKYLPNMLACHVSILHNAQGPNNSITESEVAGLLAMAEASRILRRNQADFFLVGGAESKINPLSMVRQCLFGHLSKRNDEPQKACRPFEKSRDGVVLGEGGGVLVVEDLEHARRRGAHIYGEVIGAGAAFDRKSLAGGLARAIAAALKQANVGADQIDHINAHGQGAQKGDVQEAQGFQQVFGSDVPPVWSAKSFMGNLGAGCGTTELAASLLALQHGELPGILNFDEPDAACAVPVVRSTRAVTKPCVLKVGYNDMGQCAALVVRKF